MVWKTLTTLWSRFKPHSEQSWLCRTIVFRYDTPAKAGAI